jgi:hypothetical protein
MTGTGEVCGVETEFRAGITVERALRHQELGDVGGQIRGKAIALRDGAEIGPFGVESGSTRSAATSAAASATPVPHRVSLFAGAVRSVLSSIGLSAEAYWIGAWGSARRP